MFILDVLVFLICAILVVLTGSLIRFAFILANVPSSYINKAKVNLGDVTFGQILSGDINAYRKSGRKDFAVSRGLAYDTKTNKAKLQGRLSDEIVDPLT